MEPLPKELYDHMWFFIAFFSPVFLLGLKMMLMVELLRLLGYVNLWLKRHLGGIPYDSESLGQRKLYPHKKSREN